MKLLAFDTSTEHLSVAVARDGQLWEYSGAGGARASNDLIATVLDLLRQAGLRMSELDAISFGAGPGSFTGLRTACAVAQGLAYGANVPVLPVNSLMAVADAAGGEEVIALLDARMDEIYWARFAKADGRWQTVSDAALVSPQNFVAQLPSAPLRLAGNAFAVYAPLAALAPRFECIQALPTAAAMLRLAPVLLQQGLAVPADQALPTYVRDKVAKTTAERAAEKANAA